MIGSVRVKLPGVLYAGPQRTATGEVRIVTIPTQQRTVAILSIPNDLGLVIKASRPRELDALVVDALNSVQGAGCGRRSLPTGPDPPATNADHRDRNTAAWFCRSCPGHARFPRLALPHPTSGSPLPVTMEATIAAAPLSSSWLAAFSGCPARSLCLPVGCSNDSLTSYTGDVTRYVRRASLTLKTDESTIETVSFEPGDKILLNAQEMKEEDWKQVEKTKAG